MFNLHASFNFVKSYINHIVHPSASSIMLYLSVVLLIVPNNEPFLWNIKISYLPSSLWVYTMIFSLQICFQHLLIPVHPFQSMRRGLLIPQLRCVVGILIFLNPGRYHVPKYYASIWLIYKTSDLSKPIETNNTESYLNKLFHMCLCCEVHNNWLTH